jgi:hypothetical protein
MSWCDDLSYAGRDCLRHEKLMALAAIDLGRPVVSYLSRRAVTLGPI